VVVVVIMVMVMVAMLAALVHHVLHARVVAATKGVSIVAARFTGYVFRVAVLITIVHAWPAMIFVVLARSFEAVVEATATYLLIFTRRRFPWLLWAVGGSVDLGKRGEGEG
jgi:hypothetical protein